MINKIYYQKPANINELDLGVWCLFDPILIGQLYPPF